LILQSGSLELGTIEAPELRHFEVRTGGLTFANIQSVCAAAWPKLERLILWFCDENYGAEGGVDEIRAILEGKGLAQVKHLGLMNAVFTDDLCQMIHEAKILPQLETLNLSMGTMSDEGAQALAAHAQAFKHLARLDVSDNCMSEEGVALLAGLCREVNTADQRDYGEEDRYVSVGE